MGKKIDLTNQNFGRLTVLKENGKDSKGKILWSCQCSCGTIKDIRGSDLRSGKTLSCGCLRNNRVRESKKSIQPKIGYREDLTGQIFNRLTVLEFDEETTLINRQTGKGKFSWWKCQCECGNIVSVRSTQLKNNHTKSCGCLQKEKAKQHINKIQSMGAESRLIDLTGQRFGKLVVLYRHNENNNQNKPRWVCQCDCGNIHIVNGDNLRNHYTQSCGCLGKSLGEDLIRTILLENNIPFNQEIKFPDLKDNNYLRFDFGLLDQDGNIIKLIEYDGRQHFDKTSLWYNETAIKHDKMKDDYCKNNNIPLLRISYKEFNQINLDMLLNNITL